MSQAIPEGFNALPPEQGFTDAFAPVYINTNGPEPTIGLRVESQHLNSMKICHGAVYMGLFDIGMSCAVGYALGKFVGTPTVNININYMAASKEGEWLDVECQCTRLSRTMGFTQGTIRCGDEVKATATGIFKLPPDVANAPGVTVEEIERNKLFETERF